MEYNEESFWAGFIAGQQSRGWGTYGRPEGFDPDGDLILRPITQGVPRISFGPDIPFVIRAIVDSVESAFPEQELPGIVQNVGRISFSDAGSFSIRAISERLVIDEVIQAFTVSEEINPLEYDDTIVFINSSGAFTMESMTRTFASTEQAVDVGTLQEVTVSTDEFAEVTEQEVST